MSCAKMAKPIDLPFGLLTLVDPRQHNFNCIGQVAPMCPPANVPSREGTLAPSDECNRTVRLLRQITLTTCYYYYPPVNIG